MEMKQKCAKHIKINTNKGWSIGQLGLNGQHKRRVSDWVESTQGVKAWTLRDPDAKMHLITRFSDL